MNKSRILIALLTLVCTSAASVTISLTAVAFPVLLTGSQLSSIFGKTRNGIIAVKADGSTFQRVALQIDEVEDDAALVLRNPYEVRKVREKLAHPQKSDPFSGRLYNVHRIVVDDRDFSVCAEDCQKKLSLQLKAICKSESAHGLLRVTLLDSQKSLFIADCGIAVSEMSARDIKYDPKTKSVTTQKYNFVHASEKNIFFNEIRIHPEIRPALTRSELKVFLKPKYLFNMKFKDDDLVSQITSLSRGSQSLSMEVAVALNLLAMKINSQICCDVSFYEDALYFPVVLDLPFSGNSFAKGSGVFFGFQTDKESNVKTEFIPSSTAGSSDAILLQQGKNLIALGFRSPLKKQASSVRPKVVTQSDMESIKFMPVQSPSGIFYDIQTAQEGFQHFMVWMLFGPDSDRAKLIEYAQHGAKVRVEDITNPAAR